MHLAIGSARPTQLALMLAIVLAGCATAAKQEADSGRVVSKKPLFGFRVSARPLAEVPGYLQIVASHRSRNHRIEKVVVVGPRGRMLKPVSVLKDRVVPHGAQVLGRPGVGVGIGTGGIGFGIGAPVNFDAFLDSIVLPERSRWRWRTLATVRLSPGAVRPIPKNRWRVRVTLTDRQGTLVHIERPLTVISHNHHHG